MALATGAGGITVSVNVTERPEAGIDAVTVAFPAVGPACRAICAYPAALVTTEEDDKLTGPAAENTTV